MGNDRVSQSRSAAEELARAYQENGDEESATLMRKSAVSLADLVEGDYDVLIARKLRAAAELLLSEGRSQNFVRTMHEVLAEVDEAFSGE
ncbi:MAG: hypothetical protein WCD12_22550 [Candidatus Binatus sp.]|jgi:hypothetical protein|uniref:hypothetical protein n=1 Tax=Candidatus Binatus sp. TaxID=2811406 RepID=UPI003C757B73